MRIADPSYKPSKEAIADLEKKLAAPKPASSEPRDKPSFFTEEMEKQWLAEGKKIPLLLALQYELDKQKKIPGRQYY